MLTTIPIRIKALRTSNGKKRAILIVRTIVIPQLPLVETYLN